jgi:hypothetical protein
MVISRYLCNTSGSGKTRLLLEGLWRNWGLYFTARSEFDDIGSSDLEDILRDMKESNRFTLLTQHNWKTALATNREVASRSFLLLLYVRLLALRIFLECARDRPGGLADHHKGKWLLLQLASKKFLLSDVFSIWTGVLRGSSLEFLSEQAATEVKLIQDISGSPYLFCVLDESQIPARLFEDYFLSDTKPAKPRPILRQIIQTWRSIIQNLIISGTGMSMAKLETVLGSLVAREGGSKPVVITDTGAFDNPEDQRGYLEQYFPPKFLNSAEGRLVLTRVGYWLHGRYVFP